MAVETPNSDDRVTPASAAKTGWQQLYRTEDWWAVWIGGAILALCTIFVWHGMASGEKGGELLKAWLAKPGSWKANPLDAFTVKGANVLPGVCGAFLVSLFAFGLGVSAITKQFLRFSIGCCVMFLLDALALAVAGPSLVWFLLCLVAFGYGLRLMGKPLAKFAAGFCVVFLLGLLAFVLAGQTVIKYYNLEYALWALLVGLLISNTVGTASWIRSAVCTEFYIKTGLVLLGAEILLGRLLALGLPGVFVAWVVTPIVLIGTFWFGQRILRIGSPTLNIVISADMSVCGVSAAIATAAACKAKRAELSLAIGLSLAFTVIMMVVMPAAIRAMGMSNVLGGAWLGGTIDSTGAVAAAGAMLGEDALAVAATVKMIQNILIGVVAFGVAVYWVTRVEREAGGARPGLIEIWHRFPKFILGFVAASVVFSWLAGASADGERVVDTVLEHTGATLRSWFFCLAFVSIGLETNFRELAAYMKGGKPLVLYVVGQTFNLCLTLLMAWLMFEKVFPHAADVLQK